MKRRVQLHPRVTRSLEREQPHPRVTRPIEREQPSPRVADSIKREQSHPRANRSIEREQLHPRVTRSIERERARLGRAEALLRCLIVASMYDDCLDVGSVAETAWRLVRTAIRRLDAVELARLLEVTPRDSEKR